MNEHLTGQPTQPLAGIRVLDLSRALGRPCCTMMLAHAGDDIWRQEALR